MYTTVKLCVKYNNTFSQFFNSYIGLKQGDPSSPLLFMLFVNGMLQHINSNLNGIFYIWWNEILSHSIRRLSGVFCQISPIIAISSHRYRKLLRRMGPTYKYIKNQGDDFRERNSNWYRSQKCIAQHASRALYNLCTVFNKIELPTSQKCKPFDSLVGSILNFGAEIWGTHEASDIELVHTKFLRRILNVKKSTNLTTLYGELGRVPLMVFRKVMIKY